MDFVSGLGTWGAWLLGYVIPFLFVLTVVVFFHELGHFWVARRCGVKIDAFSVGFGPELLGWTDRHGTRWRLAAIPLGGYVRFHGDDSAASTPDLKALEKMGAEEKRGSVLSQAGGATGGGRRRRADRQFHPRDRDFRGHVRSWSASR